MKKMMFNFLLHHLMSMSGIRKELGQITHSLPPIELTKEHNHSNLVIVVGISMLLFQLVLQAPENFISSFRTKILDVFEIAKAL